MNKRIISLILCLLMLLTAFQIPAFAEFGEVKEEIYDQMNQTFTPVDISLVANMDFADEIAGDGKGGWTDQGSVNDMRYFDKFGNVKFRGVDFNIIDPSKNKGKAVITLRGQNLETLPNKVEVPIGQKAAGAYILHAAAYVVDNIATYSFVYDDGTRYDVPIRNKQEIFNFWGTGISERCKQAWNGINDSTTSVSLYIYTMENPYPDKVISKMEFATTGSDAFCMIAGVTLTDKGPFMMQDSDRGNPDTSDWYPYEKPTFDTIADTVLDFSWLHEGTAGEHGWLQSKDGELVFEDGTPANFWGTNIGETIFADHKRIDKIVNRISAMGFNLVRIHNYMAQFMGVRNIFASGSPKKQLNAMRADQLCYAIAKLKEKGIYIYLDMYTSNGGGEDLNLRSNKGTDPYIITWADDDHWKIDEDYVRDLLGTYNPYTGCTLGEEKAIAFIDMKNENSLLHAGRSGSKKYHADFLKKYNDWLKEKYGTDAELEKAWIYAGKSGLKDGESLENGNVEIGYVGEREQYNRPRYEDNMHFLADMMTKYYYHHGAIIRELGYGGLMTQCTVWAMYYPTLMYSLTESDLTDSHVYWSHPSAYDSVMGKQTTMGGNTAISMLEDKNFGYMGHLFSESVFKMPHTITEWDECDLNPTMCEEYTLMGAISSLQNWQPLNFAFATQNDEVTEIKTTDGPRKNATTDQYNGDPNSIRAYWAANNNPVKMGCMPAGAVMKLRGDVKRADVGFYRRYSQNNYFNPAAQTLNRDPAIGMIGNSGIAYDKREYDEGYNDDSVLYRAYMSKKLGIPYVSVTGEIRTDLVNATFEVNTERSQAVTGRIINKDFETDDMIVNVSNPFANINLTSLTDDPIYSSDHMLLTAAGDQRNTDEIRSNDGLSIVQGGQAPILVEPIKGTVTIKTTDDIKVYTIASTGARKGEARVEKDKNGYSVIRLRADDTCMNYEIVRTSGSGKKNEHIVYEQLEVKPLFTDLAGYEWAEKAITRNCLLGDMTGVSETTFAPGANITRGDFVDAVVNACKLKVEFDSNFADVTDDDKNYNAIGIAKEFGIVGGDENGNFHPNESISRADAMNILAKVIKTGNVQHKDTDSNVFDKYSDFDAIPSYAADSAKKMLSQDYVAELMAGGKVEPQKKLTRAETAYIVYGILWR